MDNLFQPFFSYADVIGFGCNLIEISSDRLNSLQLNDCQMNQLNQMFCTTADSFNGIDVCSQL